MKQPKLMLLARRAADAWDLPSLWPANRLLRRVTEAGARTRPSKLALITASLGACLACASAAEGGDANSGVHWLRKCTNPEPALQIECTIYVRAIVEYDEARANMPGQRRFICPEKGLTMGQAREVVVSYLRDKPDELHRPFALLAHSALQGAFPCDRPR